MAINLTNYTYRFVKNKLYKVVQKDNRIVHKLLNTANLSIECCLIVAAVSLPSVASAVPDDAGP